jgi:hypothetical protein
MRFRLRTLMIVLAIGPMVLPATWWSYFGWRQSEIHDQRPLQELENRHWPKRLRIPD